MAHLTPSVYDLVKERRVHSPRYACQFELFSRGVFSRLYHRFEDSSPPSPAEDQESPYGSVFNLDFSPVEDLVVAVCANRAILAYDPRTHARVSVVPHAHEDGVNCVTFLDSFTLATCSDDHTIRLWDLRNLHGSTAVLSGHSNWVKNIEYDRRSRMLFSVAFHEGVRAWDLNKLDSYTEETDNLVLKFKDPVRMKISPGGSKMFVSTRETMCVVIEQFEARSLHKIAASVESLMLEHWSPHNSVIQRLKRRKTNQPVVHFMSGLKSTSSFRAVMSAAFQSDGFIGLRHIDVKKDLVCQELTTLYDVRTTDDEYHPYHRVDKCRDKYRKYVDEESPSEAINFIKEISFSRDGRVLASPYEDGVRLLAVDHLCTPAEVYFDDRYHSWDKSLCSYEFEELGVCYGHSAPVLTCKFAHNDLMLATGCLAGKVKFHNPRL